jgi:hypothetical protein
VDVLAPIVVIAPENHFLPEKTHISVTLDTRYGKIVSKEVSRATIIGGGCLVVEWVDKFASFQATLTVSNSAASIQHILDLQRTFCQGPKISYPHNPASINFTGLERMLPLGRVNGW